MIWDIIWYIIQWIIYSLLYIAIHYKYDILHPSNRWDIAINSWDISYLYISSNGKLLISVTGTDCEISFSFWWRGNSRSQFHRLDKSGKTAQAATASINWYLAPRLAVASPFHYMSHVMAPSSYTCLHSGDFALTRQYALVASPARPHAPSKIDSNL